MTSQLRWILLIIGTVFVVALFWWERRRPRQASASSASERPAPRELSGEPLPRVHREPVLSLPEMRARDPLPTHELPEMDAGADDVLPVIEAPALAASEAPTDEVVALTEPEAIPEEAPEPAAAPR